MLASSLAAEEGCIREALSVRDVLGLERGTAGAFSRCIREALSVRDVLCTSLLGAVTVSGRNGDGLSARDVLVVLPPAASEDGCTGEGLSVGDVPMLASPLVVEGVCTGEPLPACNAPSVPSPLAVPASKSSDREKELMDHTLPTPCDNDTVNYWQNIKYSKIFCIAQRQSTSKTHRTDEHAVRIDPIRRNRSSEPTFVLELNHRSTLTTPLSLSDSGGYRLPHSTRDPHPTDTALKREEPAWP